LAQRGYCCNSGCRHCPYRKKEKEPMKEGEFDLKNEEPSKISSDKNKNLKK
jgi:hypothetical protein